ncbi:MAG: DUF4097 family beta strand repeat protein [Bdellovibrionales bacterium]|nr:DUF4097 family beta strand repeat protein [Bdellovibrionales bacterium]
MALVRSFVVISVLFFVNIFAHSETQEIVQKRATVPAEQVKSIYVKGYVGTVEFVEKANLSQIELKYSYKQEASWSVETHLDSKGQFLVEVKGPDSKEQWPRVLSEYPDIKMTIEGPARPVQCFLKKGELKFDQWSGDIFSHLQSGNLVLSGGKGEADLTSHDGEIMIKGREGDIQVETYRSQVVINSAVGKVNVNNYSGKTELVKTDAEITLASHKGQTRVQDSQGKLNFKNGISPLKIESFEGEVRGDSEQGAVVARLKGELNVRIHSVEGPVDISTRNSGARVNLGTINGQFNVAPYLKLTRYRSIKVMSGRLRGEKKGYVFVRTESGQIRIR